MSLATVSERSLHAQGYDRGTLILTTIQAADEWRRRLGIADRCALPEDAWLLADALAEEVSVEHCPTTPNSYIVYTRGRSHVMLASYDSAWKEAEVLAHELGHHLLTQPTEEEWGLCPREFHCPERSRPIELVAIIFAHVFLDLPLKK